MAAKAKTRKGRKSRTSRKVGVNLDLVKALAHELRVEILTILNERMASPNELSKELGEGLSQVSYHVKVLKDYKCITQVKTVPRRGAVEHYYRATSRPYLSDRDWLQLPASVREGMSADLVQMVIDDASDALEAETLDAHKNRHMSRTPMQLDEKGWDDIGELLTSTLDAVMKIQTDSSTRLAKSDEEGIHAVVALLGIEMPAKAKKTPTRKRKAKGKAKAKAKAKAKGKAKGKARK
ncbi:MAG: winged helix-turn-helix domain-containing protein [Solirubrobacterales bacterium]